VKFSGKAVLYMALVFASGAVLGVMGNRSYTAYKSSNTVKGKNRERRPAPTPEEYRQGVIRYFEQRLKLTAEQATQLGLVLDETRAQFDEFRRRTDPEQAAIADGQSERIRKILNEEQRAEFEVMLKEREEQRGRGKGNKFKGDRRGGGPGF
jgi:hypothetical protein